MADEDLTARLRADGQTAFSRAMRRASGDVRGVGKAGRLAGGGVRVFGGAVASSARGMRLTAGVAGGALAGGLAAAGIAAKSAVSAFEEKRQIVAQTGAVLKSTGGAANITEKHIDSLSTRLSRMSGVDDETVRQGQNLLLTFRDIRNEKGPGNVFDETTRATLDLSAAMGMDMPQAALQVGKAINDPVRGFKRLQRIGVSFTKTQEDQIKHFDKVGDRASAQRVILAELNAEFAGSAKAQMTPLKRLRVSWGNIQEAIGGGLAPAVDVVASRFDRFFVSAEPKVIRFGDRLHELLTRKDLTGKRKLELAVESGGNLLAPVRAEVTRFWTDNRQTIIDGATSAMSSAGSHMATAAAAAAPHVAGMFVDAFKHASPWGKVLTVGLLASKLGVFSTLGRMAAGRMCGSVASRLPGCIGTKVGAAGAMRPVASALAGSLALALPAALVTAGIAGIVMAATLPTDDPATSATSGNPEGVRAHHRIKPGTGPTGAQIEAGRHPDPGRGHSRDPAGIGATPVGPTLGRKSVTPFARQGAAPTAARGRGALLHVTVPVKVHNREIGRASARIAGDDLAGP